MSLVREAISSRIPEMPDGLSLDVRMATERQRTYTGLVEERSLLTPGFMMENDPMILAAAEAGSMSR